MAEIAHFQKTQNDNDSGSMIPQESKQLDGSKIMRRRKTVK